MRALVVSLIAALGTLACPGAGFALALWQGEAVITTASGHCTFPGDERRNISTGTVLKSVFRPKLIDNNGANTRISFMHDSGALFMMVLQDTGPNGDYAKIGVTHSALLVNSGLSEFASFQQVPANPGANTLFIKVSGRVADFMFLNGCDATFRATYTKR